MESTSSKVGARAPFSFHCNICYDAFNLTDRAPVVLPCGHTYLCEPCSVRLDRCMECRTPLTTKVKKGECASPRGHYGGNRYGLAPELDRTPSYRRRQLSTPAPLQTLYEDVRLPVPKNHVLMCLIDAVQKSSGQAIKNDDGYESGDDDELVFRGMKVLGSSSGTYIVREPTGLNVYPIPPKNSDKPHPTGTQTMTLRYGQTVQIFLFENKIATIARGAGYILVDHSSQLIKIGEVTDEASKFEAASRVIDSEIASTMRQVERLQRVLCSVNSKLEQLTAEKTNSVFGPIPDDMSEDGASDSSTDEEIENRSDDTLGDFPRQKSGRSLAPKPILKRPHSIILETQSYDDQPASFLPCIPAIEPSRSFENLANYISGQGNEERESEDAMISYWTQYWSNDGGEIDRARRLNSQSMRLSSRPNSAAGVEYAGTIDFACGLSGHTGLNGGHNGSRPTTGRRPRRVMMMSHY